MHAWHWDNATMRAILFGVLLAAACRTAEVTYSTDFDDFHMFGGRLDAGTGARVLCWPADAKGERFRCVEDRIDRKISEQTVLLWPDARPPGSTGSVIVVLPPDVSDGLRARAGKLVDDLTRGSPWAGRHLVTADESWHEVTGGRDLALRLRDLHDRAKAWRATESEDGIFLTWNDLSGRTADVIIVPVEGENRHVVLQGIRLSPPARPAGGCAQAAKEGARWEPVFARWEAKSKASLSLEEIRKLPRRASAEGEPYPVLFEIVFLDGDGPARERASRIAADLIALPRTTVYLRPEPDPAIAQGTLPASFAPACVSEGLVLGLVGTAGPTQGDRNPR